MSRKQFEYFFDPQDLEPYFSELLPGDSWPKNKPKNKPSPRRKEIREGRQAQQNHVAESTNSPSEPSERLETDDAATDSNTGPVVTTEIGDSSEQPTNVSSTVECTPAEAAGVSSEQFELPQPAREAETAGGQESESYPHTRIRNMLSVHALGQYVFCPRSAILAAERGDDRDMDEPLPRLTFLPNFDLDRIEEVLSLKFKQLLMAIALVVVLPLSMVVSLRDESWGQFYLGAGTLFLSLLWAANLLTAIAQLAVRRFSALNAEAREPDVPFNGTQPVNWWSMLNAGFEPITYQRPFQHPELPLEGCPWRVLHKDSLRIPVIRAGGEQLGTGTNRLFPKHEVRLAAYGLLLEADGHHRVPYGLVFPADSPRGIAFSITDHHRQQAIQLLSDFEQQLNESQQRNVQPSLPQNRNRCANCDYGKPVGTSIREVNSLRKAGEQVVILQSRSDTIFRCDCADRFGSAPPHRDSIRMSLRAVLE